MIVLCCLDLALTELKSALLVWCLMTGLHRFIVHEKKEYCLVSKTVLNCIVY